MAIFVRSHSNAMYKPFKLLVSSVFLVNDKLEGKNERGKRRMVQDELHIHDNILASSKQNRTDAN